MQRSNEAAETRAGGTGEVWEKSEALCVQPYLRCAEIDSLLVAFMRDETLN